MTGKYQCSIVIFVLAFFCFTQNVFSQQINIIPYPQSVVKAQGKFTITGSTKIFYGEQDDKQLPTALAPLVLKLQQAAGIALKTTQREPRKNFIRVELSSSISKAEGYHLEISSKGVTIRAATPAGVFYAVQSLLQLLPVEIESPVIVKNLSLQLPAMVIEDAPAFSYRGLMLDVARHYMPYDFLEKMIDLMAMQKMNTLHLHLTDSQGWRFESKKYPRLNTIAAYRKGTPLIYSYDYASMSHDTLYGGYYTQEQLKKLVAYAASRFITIIPEIEMPAHSRSALAAYPQFACLDSAGKPFAYPANIQDEYCTKDSTFIFLTDILSEVMDVFPSKYIHIGGDEATKLNWTKCPICQKRMKDEGLKSVDELQSYFIKRIERFVNSKGRNIIGWDEILQGGLAPGATVMSWTGEQGGIDAAKMGHRVIMTPGDYCYLDHYQSTDPAEPVAIGDLLTLPTVYSYHPVPAGLTDEEAKLITGAQGNLWTEFVPTPAHAEYMYFPRSLALAEDTWTNTKQPYDEFISRLLPYLKRLDLHNVNYSRHMFEIKVTAATDPVSRQLTAQVSGVPPGFEIYYTTDGSRPTTRSFKYSGQIKITGNERLYVAVIYDGQLVDAVQKNFTKNKATGKPSYLKTPPSKDYNKGGDNAWNNGILGSDTRYNDNEWLGWNGQDFEGTVDLGSETPVDTVSARFFNKPSDWVYMPVWVSVSVSDNGIDFKEIARRTDLQNEREGMQQIKFNFNGVKARYLRITAKCYNPIEKGKPGEGNPGWVFVDEVQVE